MHKSKSTPQDQPIQQPLNHNMLQHYNVDSVEQLIKIMINSTQSQLYHQVRNQPTPAIDLQKFSTVKSSVQYKRNLLLQLFHTASGQVKNKIHMEKKLGDNDSPNRKDKSKASQKGVHKKSENLEDEINQGSSNGIKISRNQNVSTSHHSYQELQTYFNINRDQLLCRKILSLKYHRNEMIQAHKIRKQFWLHLIGIDKKRALYPNMFQDITEYKEYPDFFDKIIHADVIRTIHDTDEKTKKQNLQKMHKVLQAYARRNPYVGYCQGMNFILHFIMTMGFEDEECFWILFTLIQEIVPLGYYTNMSGVAVDIKILQIILGLLHPTLSKKLLSLQIDISIFVLQWLVCLFTSTIPFYLLVIVWDLVFIEGTVALLKVALILLQYLGSAIEEAKDFAHFFKLYENLKKKMFIEEQNFIKKYNNIYIDEKLLSFSRQIIESQIRATKDQLRKVSKENQKWKQNQCNEKWPICFQELKKHKHNDLQIDVWIFRDQNGPVVVDDFLNKKNKKNIKSKSNEDGRDAQKKLVIGRVPHICAEGESGLKPTSTNTFQLDEFDKKQPRYNFGVQYLNRISLQQPQSTQQQQSTDFFRRATYNTITFQALLQNQNKRTKQV